MLTHATTILDACSSPHPEVTAWIDANTSVRFPLGVQSQVYQVHVFDVVTLASP